jgi:hypothetical protein
MRNAYNIQSKSNRPRTKQHTAQQQAANSARGTVPGLIDPTRSRDAIVLDHNGQPSRNWVEYPTKKDKVGEGPVATGLAHRRKLADLRAIEMATSRDGIIAEGERKSNATIP